MSYQLDIQDNTLCIKGLFGVYEAEDDGDGRFIVSVIQESCVNELDSDGEEYFVESGQEWNIIVENLSELNSFITNCENEKMWNYMCGPVFKMKPDIANGLLYLKGQTKNFVIGDYENKLYIDELQTSKNHNYVDEFIGLTRELTKQDKWWNRTAEETLDIVRNVKSTAMITSGGNMKIEYKNKSFVIGQKDDGNFWINIMDNQERHIYYKSSWSEVLNLLQ